MPPVPSVVEQVALQRRTVLTLMASQVIGSIGAASGIAVTALLARRVSGSDSLAGLGTTFQVLGAALLAVPLARLMARRGRRPGLALGYTLAAAGGLLVIVATAVGSFPLLLVGTALFGGATASGNATRYAAADLANPGHRGRDLSLVVWAATAGSVVGPNLIGPGEPVATLLHLPELTGSYVFAVVGFGAACATMLILLRPDPLLVSRRIAQVEGHGGHERPTRHASIAEGLRLIAGHRDALLGLIVIALGHAVMVGVMVMTPLHMEHGGAELRLIGLVISVHIFGMYALSPLTGLAVDRFGGRAVALAGSAILVVSCVMAAMSHAGMSTLLAVGLFLLGVGWSCTLVSGSTLLTGAIAVADRATTQGVSDLCMGLAGGGAGAAAGLVLQLAGYPALAAIGALVALLVAGAVATLRTVRAPSHQTRGDRTRSAPTSTDETPRDQT